MEQAVLDFIYKLSDLYIFILLSVAISLVTIIAVYIVRKILPLKLRSRDNAVIGNIGNIVGLIYGVLVGLTALYLFNNNSYTTDAVQHEANAAANIAREAVWLKEPARSTIQSDIKNYVDKVIHVEWPLMREGKDLSNENDFVIEKINKELLQYSVENKSDDLIIRDLVTEVKALYNGRQQRIVMSNSSLSPEIWEVIIIGTILTIGINFLYRVSLHLHLIAIIAAGLMASSMIFLLVTLDRPFQGEFIIEPDAFKSVLIFFDAKANLPVNSK